MKSKCLAFNSHRIDCPPCKKQVIAIDRIILSKDVYQGIMIQSSLFKDHPRRQFPENLREARIDQLVQTGVFQSKREAIRTVSRIISIRQYRAMVNEELMIQNAVTPMLKAKMAQRIFHASPRDVIEIMHKISKLANTAHMI